MNATTAERDASAMSLNLNLGGAYSRFESFSRLTGEGARSDMLAVVGCARRAGVRRAHFAGSRFAAHDERFALQEFAQRSDRARLSADLIRVEPHAHFTDAYQTVRNLLLSDDAEANSMPGLEILADNVKCSHGATSGQLNEEELFYLLARGIPKNVAQHLLVAGFLDEVVQRLDQPKDRGEVARSDRRRSSLPRSTFQPRPRAFRIRAVGTRKAGAPLSAPA